MQRPARASRGLDTICAPATGLAPAALAVLRVSGPDALAICRDLAPTLAERPAPRRMALRELRRGDERLDEALVVFFPGPNSATGEDVVELHVHGGVRNVQRVLDALVDAGARPAEPGEFTRRALRHGRIDLTQAEALADVAHARSEAALRLAQRHLAGGLRDVAAGWRAAIVELLTLVEAGIDFSLEEDVWSIAPDEIVERAQPVVAELRARLARVDHRRLVSARGRVAIVGLPNAGKSSLLNALLGHDRAIVTPIAGTTRDSIEESFELGGIAFRIADTAGLRETDDVVEQAGIARTRALAREADVVLVVVDARRGTDLDALTREVGETRRIVVWNWTDQPDAAPPPEGAIPTALIDGRGADAVRDALLGCVAPGHDAEDDVLLARARHRDAVARAADALARAIDAARALQPLEIVALELREAADAIGSLSGAVTADEILNRIFDGFCIGK